MPPTRSRSLDAEGAPTGFELSDVVLVVDLDGASVAVPVVFVRAEEVINGEVGDLPVAAVVDPAPRRRPAAPTSRVHVVPDDYRRFFRQGRIWSRRR